MPPRFQLGDVVRVIRQGPYNNRSGVIVEVIPRTMLPQYVVQHGTDYRRYFEFDLSKAREREDAAPPDVSR